MSDQFPGTGKRFEARFGDLAFQVDFATDGRSMSFEQLGGDVAGIEGAQTVAYEATELRDGLWQVTWQEAGGTTITHLEDFSQGRVHSNITMPDGTFLKLAGTWTEVG